MNPDIWCYCYISVNTDSTDNFDYLLLSCDLFKQEIKLSSLKWKL